jgi:tripartite-type tricarboxylate transporter receptor subunit TctC
VRVLGGGTLRQRLEEQGFEVTPSTPDQFVSHVRSETAQWSKVVKEANLGPE